ncbi:ABC transporter permease [Pseudonocardia sp. TRM90224]|uniref:ABC transporter permease n=1 Tax=Pseudonocardia sp. TRM90224 TaxID=2812678 RepID=UPI001E6233CA|nr:ABC transporter permease [Pseudonocardia sp. TRM90224]
MMSLVRAELLKVRSSRDVWWIAIVPVLVSAATTASFVGYATSAGGPLETGEPGIRASMYGAVFTATVLAMFYGAQIVTNEFRHGTATATFLTTAQRRRVIAAKAVAAAVTGVVLAVIAAAVNLAIAVPWLASLGFEINILDPEVGGVLVSAAASAPLFGVLGVGLAALIRNPTVTIIVAIAWLFFVENVLMTAIPASGNWLPSGAADAIAGNRAVDITVAPIWAGALVLLAWAAVTLTAGQAVMARRDLA